MRRSPLSEPSIGAPWRIQVGTDEEGRAIYGPWYLPRSCRTGRPVAYTTALRDWDESHGAVGSAGLWDHSIDPGPAAQPVALSAEVLQCVGSLPWLYSPREQEIADLFFEQRQSVQVCAIDLGISEGYVTQLIVALRRKTRRIMEGS